MTETNDVTVWLVAGSTPLHVMLPGSFHIVSKRAHWLEKNKWFSFQGVLPKCEVFLGPIMCSGVQKITKAIWFGIYSSAQFQTLSYGFPSCHSQWIAPSIGGTCSCLTLSYHFGVNLRFPWPEQDKHIGYIDKTSLKANNKLFNSETFRTSILNRARGDDHN